MNTNEPKPYTHVVAYRVGTYTGSESVVMDITTWTLAERLDPSWQSMSWYHSLEDAQKQLELDKSEEPEK